MKLLKVTSFALLTLSVLFTGNARAAVIHAVGVDNQTTSTNNGVITSWATLGVDGTLPTETHTVVGSTVDGELFDYVITVTATTGNLSLLGGSSLLGKNGGNFAEGEGFDITIDGITNPLVQFDGFVQISYGNSGNAEGASISDGLTTTDYTRVPDGLAPALSPQVLTSTLEWRGIGDSTLGRYLDFQFSTSVPEPSSISSILFGIFGILAFLWARRRR